MEAGFEHLAEALAETFAKDVEFPRGCLVTVLHAKLTANTIHAKITLSVFPESMINDVRNTLKIHQREIKNGLAKRLRLRRIPRLHFYFDETEAEAAVIEDAINEYKKEIGE